MLGLDARAARTTWTAAAVLLLLYLVYLIRRTLFVFVVALLFAYLLSPLVDLLARLFPAGRARKPALALAYLLLIGVLAAGGTAIVSSAVEQAGVLKTQLPAVLARVEQATSAPAPQDQSLQAQLLRKVREQVAERSNQIVSALPQVGLRFLSLAGHLVYVIIVPILGFFFLKDSREIREYFVGLVESERVRAMLEELLADAHLLLAQYMRAIFLLSIATLVSYSVFLSILGLQYAVLLGAIAGALEFVPTIGPLTAVAVILLVVGFGGGSLVAVLVFLVLYRLFQDYVLSPYLLSSGVELHPLAVLFGVFAGAEVAGIAGAFLSVPVLALLRVLYQWMRKVRRAARAPLATP
ncbi:MAG TPA: AI-2E family transporter [Bryobacteraceae bacterium]|nr:AI-2E family transporter [Bryobacteraceae bacterium]